MFINWKLHINDANVVLQGLGELPTKVSGALAFHLKAEADRQVEEQSKPVGTAGEAPQAAEQKPAGEAPSETKKA